MSGALRPDDYGVVPRHLRLVPRGPAARRDSRCSCPARPKARRQILHHVEARHHEAPSANAAHTPCRAGVPPLVPFGSYPRATPLSATPRRHARRVRLVHQRARGLDLRRALATRATRRARQRGRRRPGTANRRRGHRPSRDPRRPRGSSRTSSGGPRCPRDSPTIASPSDELRSRTSRARLRGRRRAIPDATHASDAMLPLPRPGIPRRGGRVHRKSSAPRGLADQATSTVSLLARRTELFWKHSPL